MSCKFGAVNSAGKLSAFQMHPRPRNHGEERDTLCKMWSQSVKGFITYTEIGFFQSELCLGSVRKQTLSSHAVHLCICNPVKLPFFMLSSLKKVSMGQCRLSSVDRKLIPLYNKKMEPWTSAKTKCHFSKCQCPC